MSISSPRKAHPTIIPAGVEAIRYGGKIRYQGSCEKCGIWRFSLHKDHAVAIHKGGPDVPSNIQLLCANCHEDKTREDYRGFKHTAATKAKISASKVGKPLTAAHRASLSKGLRGRKFSPEHIANLSKPRSASTRANIKSGIRRFFANMTPAQRKKFLREREEKKRNSVQLRTTAQKVALFDKMSAIRRGRPVSKEQRAKMSIAMRGRKKSAEHRAKISAAHIKFHAERREKL